MSVCFVVNKFCSQQLEGSIVFKSYEITVSCVFWIKGVLHLPPKISMFSGLSPKKKKKKNFLKNRLCIL